MLGLQVVPCVLSHPHSPLPPPCCPHLPFSPLPHLPPADSGALALGSQAWDTMTGSLMPLSRNILSLFIIWHFFSNMSLLFIYLLLHKRKSHLARQWWQPGMGVGVGVGELLLNEKRKKKKKGRTWLLLSKEEIYCRCEGKHGQRHLEESVVNVTATLSRTREERGWGEKKVWRFKGK